MLSLRTFDVSAVIAVYNGEDFIQRAVQSVLDQTYPVTQLIIVDDGSTDNTPDVLEAFGDNPIIFVVRQPNQGQATAKNRGAREATGSLIAFLDADDFWNNDKLEQQVDHFNNKDVAVVYSNRTYIGLDDAPLQKQPEVKVRPSGKITDALIVENLIPFGSTVVRRDVFEKMGGFDQSLSMGIDWDLWLRVSVEWQFKYVDKYLLNYRIWPGQMSTNVEGRYKGALHILKNFLLKHGDTVSTGARRSAFADTYAHRGYYRVARNEDHIGGIRDLATALRHQPMNSYAWRILGKTLLSLLRLRKFN